MYTRPDASDPAVDELKRRARRRLVGAVVLALAAAVILPLLLESDPKPLGDDVSIQIPPIDSGKFVNPLSPVPAKTSDSKGGEGKRERKAAPDPSAVDAKADAISKRPAKELEQHPPAQAGAAPPASDAATAVDATKPETTQPKADTAESKSEPAAGGAFVVQVAALADVKAASDLASRLKASGYPGYTEAFATPQGAMQRVRVGPYASRETADAALAKLKASGYDGIVAAAR
jgi:DedD protein